jgi:Ni/Fe-hydrogenase subunit HybB-like protein
MPTVYCWKCSGLADAADLVCPMCGAVGPNRGRPVYLSLLAPLLVAAAVTAGFAWVLAQVWEKWERKFAGLRADHPLRDAAEESAVAFGVAVFLVAWSLAVVRLRAKV